MYTNIPNDRDNSGYNVKPRENGYRSPYDPEREWNGFSRDKDRERDREYGSNSFYQRTKREWPDREHRNAPERSPSPKRRRLRDDTESPPPYKEYKRNYDSPRYNNYRSGSRSPSPTSGHAHHEAQFAHTSTDKERYNSRDYYRNDRDFKYTRDNDYPRNNSNNNYYSDYNQRRRPWDRDNARNKYDYRGQYSSYRRDTYDEFRDSRRADYDREYDRYDRERYDKYNRDHEFDRDRYRDKEHDYENDRGRNASRDREDNDRDSRSRSRDRSGSDSEKGKSAKYSMRDDYYSPSREVEAYDQLDRKDDDDKDGNGLGSGDTPTTPTPKKRLGWGQGLVAFEKAKDPEKKEDAEASPATPTMAQVQVQRTEKVELEMMAISPPPLVKSEPVIEPIPVQTPQIQPPSQPQPQPQPQLQPQQSQQSQPQQSQPSKMQIDGNLGSPSYSPEIQEVKVEKKPEPEPPKEPLPNKEEVLLAIEKLDAEISKTEAQISILKKPKKEHKHRHLHQNLIQDVIDENKERLAQTTEDHERLLPPNMKSMTQPLYTNPKQLPSYRENIATHAKLKGKIGAIIAKRAVEYEAKQVQIKERYQKIYESWKKKVQKLEERRQRRDSKQKQSKSETDMVLDDQGHRRPMLRSVRSPITPRGRFLGDSARSEAEFEQILFHLREQDNLDPNSKYLQTLAKIPPMILKTKSPAVFIDKIGLIPDPMAVERERKLLNAWSEEEKQTFMRKFLTYGKIFSKIATFIEHKSTADVINYYYTNKKTLDLKKLLAQQQAKRRSWGRTKPATPSTPPTPTPIPGLPRELANLGVTSSSPYWSYAENARSTRVKASLSSERADQNRPSLLGGDQPEETVEVSTTWTEMEKELFLEGYAKFQTDFKAISNLIGTKNQFQCKNYYHNNKKRFAESMDESGRPRPAKVAKKESKITELKELYEMEDNKLLENEIKIRKERLDKEKLESSSPPVPTKQTPQQPVQQAQQSNSSEGEDDSSDDGPEEEITSRKGARIANTWKSEEKENFLKYFKQYGKNWKKLAALIPSKNANQIKYYYQTNCQKLNLDKIEPEIKEEVVHKKRGRKSNAEKQKLAAKKAAELPTPTTPSTPPPQNLAQPIKIKSTNSSEFVNVDQESPKTPSPSAPPSLSAVKSESSATSDNSTAMETGASERESVSRSGSVSLRAEESISNEDFDVVDEEDISEFMPSPNNETRFYEFKPKKGNELEGVVDGQTGPTTVELDSAIQTIRDPNENETKMEESLLVSLPSLKEDAAAPMDIETAQPQSAPSPSPMETEMESATVQEPVQELAPTEPAVPTSTEVFDAVPAPVDEEMKTEEPERQVPEEEAPVIEPPSIEPQLEETVSKQEEPEPAAPVSEEQVASPVSEQPTEPQPTEPLNEPVQEQPVEAQTSPVAQEAPVESEPVEEPQVVPPVEPETAPPVAEEVVPSEQVAPTTEEVAPQEPQVDQEAEMTEESAPQVPINESSVEVPVHDTRPSEEEVPAPETSQPLPEDPAPEPEPTIEFSSEQPMVEEQPQPELSSVTEFAVEPSSAEVEAPSLENLESISVPSVELEPQPEAELEPAVEVPSAMEIEPAVAPENLAPIDSVPLTEVEQKLDFPEFVPETVSNQNYKSEPVVEAPSTGTIL